MRLPADAPIKQEIDLPRKLASIVLGIKGETAGRLRRESGAKLHVVVTPHDNPMQVNLTLYMFGHGGWGF